MTPDQLNERCAQLQPLLAAYALGEAPADPELLTHLATCSTCQHELRAYAHVARLLPYTAPDAVPSPTLRSRILAAAQQLSVPAEVYSTITRLRHRLQMTWVALAGACLALLLLLGWNMSLQQQLSTQSARMMAARERWQSVIEVLNAQDVRAYPLSGNTAIGRIWASPQNTVGCLVIQHVPVIAEEQVYQVWLVQGNTYVSAGTFEASSGNAWAVVDYRGPLTTYERIIVTVEPRGGSPSPTGSQILEGSLIASQTYDAIDD